MVLSMERWVGKVAIVTGASAGIGTAIVTQLVEAGVNVVGMARRVGKIEELANTLSGKNGKLYPFKCDLSKEDEILKAFEWVKDNLGPVAILINNAGVLGNTTLIDGDTKIWNNIFSVNVMALCIATREAVKSMRSNNIDGHIIHINSISGHIVPTFGKNNVYPASKHAVTALAETLRKEFIANNLKIKITSISPGLVATEIMEAAGIFTPEMLKNRLETSPCLQPEDLADAVIYALSTPPHVQVHEMMLRPVGDLVV